MSFVLKVFKFLQTPQGKRDTTLVVAGVSAFVDALKQFGVI